MEKGSRRARSRRETAIRRNLHKTKLELQMEFQAMQTSQHLLHTNTSSDIQAKLPKLVMTKFDGTFILIPTRTARLQSKTNNRGVTLHVTGYSRAESILAEKYGKESEIVNTYTREISDIRSVPNTNPKKISEFSEKLTYCVQALQTLKKLEQVNGAVSMTLDKLPAIRGDLVRTDPDWESWDLAGLSEAIRLWVRRNPAETTRTEREQEQSAKRFTRPTKIYHARRELPGPRGCVYCGEDHRPVECTKIKGLSDRRQILLNKRLCFNCVSGNHRAFYCPSKSACQRCHKRHHTSICDTPNPTSQVNQPPAHGVALTTNQTGEGLFPVVIIEVNGIKCRALIDSGAGSSYVSAKLIELLRLKPTDVQTKTIDMLMSSKIAKLEVYDLELRSVNHQFSLAVKASKVNKRELLSIKNPNYRTLIEK